MAELLVRARNNWMLDIPLVERNTWEYRLQEKAQIQIEVIDLQGRVVRQLYQGPQSAGKHSIRWQAEAASGVYMVRMTGTSSGRTLTAAHKVLLVK